MKKIIALGGSNSKNSINKTLAIYAANKIENTEVSIIDLNNFELPLYGIDYETAHGIPENAVKLSHQIEDADGLVIALAEHNGSYTVAFKNALDWMSRIDIKVWKDKPILLLATSPGARGGTIVLESAKTYFPFLGGNVIAGFSLPNFYDTFLENQITNVELKLELIDKIHLFEQVLNDK
ncbi:NADPH-dependent FMN reductase [Hyunsoonleella pacifica]|uniref:NADPH-dependent oxidoreductase n=1 Tax=Hyunsoonleella pacifica TaxID=1080224 RepID=A0A4Q9FNA7_9FLAO|nr:NAD(P)H-dependent oxidoreductase [Hyunsoonleella pacifica]TBN13794.1 NADPH-dependent oxidoreductase [Hyunsoonleella pacifica]GGD25698.1 FMN reductase [Hyunsoonleella pacifica]